MKTNKEQQDIITKMLILSVEYGYRQCEKGENLENTLIVFNELNKRMKKSFKDKQKN